MRVNWSNIIKYIFILVTGLGIGWLVGLSISPVISIVITSVTGAAAAVIAAMSGLENKNEVDKDDTTESNQNFQWKVNPIPIAMLVIGVVVGSGIGIYVRNQDLLGRSDLSFEIKQWTDAGLDQEEVARRVFENHYSYRGWLGNDLAAEVEKWKNIGLTDQEEIARRIFESTYPLDYEPPTGATMPKLGEFGVDSNSVLFETTIQDECLKIESYVILEQDDAKFRDIIAHSTIPRIQDLPNVITDTNTLREVLKTLCKDG